MRNRKGLEPWARLSSKIHQDDEFLAASMNAQLVFFFGIAVAKDLNDDGRLHLRPLIGALHGTVEAHEIELAATELVDRGFWLSEGNGRYIVRAFLKWNESAEDQEATRARKVEGAHRTNHKKGQHVTAVDGCPLCADGLSSIDVDRAPDDLNRASNATQSRSDGGPIEPGLRSDRAPIEVGLSPNEDEGDLGQGVFPGQEGVAIAGGVADAKRPQRQRQSQRQSQRKERESDLTADAPLIDEQLCNHLADRIGAHLDGQRPRVTARWLKDMSLLRRRGPTELAKPEPISEGKIRISIDAIFERLADGDRNGFCWADQVRSAGALRRHWIAMGQDLKRQQEAKDNPTDDGPALPIGPPHDETCCGGTGLVPVGDRMAQCPGSLVGATT